MAINFLNTNFENMITLKCHRWREIRYLKLECVFSEDWNKVIMDLEVINPDRMLWRFIKRWCILVGL